MKYRSLIAFSTTKEGFISLLFSFAVSVVSSDVAAFDARTQMVVECQRSKSLSTKKEGRKPRLDSPRLGLYDRALNVCIHEYL
jgi:hypothetical protein